MEQTMSAEDAMADIRRLQSMRGALERRTSGITWMLWGFVTAGLFVTYSYAGVVGQEYDPRAFNLMAFLWIPWIALGIIATAVLWKTAGLVMPHLDNPKDGLKVSLTFMLITMAGGYATALLKLPIVEPAMMLGALGIASGVLGAWGIATTDRTERVLRLATGFFMLAIVLLMSLLVRDESAAYAWYSLVAPAACFIGFFGSGLFLATRG